MLFLPVGMVNLHNHCFLVILYFPFFTIISTSVLNIFVSSGLGIIYSHSISFKDGIFFKSLVEL